MKNNVNIVNRKVKFEYEFINTYTAGVQLFGTEVKSIRRGEISLVDGFCFFNNGEFFLKNTQIQNTQPGSSHEVNRDRKLLLKKKELNELNKKLIDGLTVVPYRIFTNDKGLIKVEVVLAKGKKVYDKRETIKKRDIERELSRRF